MRTPWSGRGRALRPARTLLPALLVLGLMLCVAPLTAVAATAAGAALDSAPPCQQCHPDEYSQWEAAPHAGATMDPMFQEQLKQQHNQEACLQCHATGFDIASQSYMAEGVTCEACHGPYKEGHPKTETMQLPMASETCRTCHQATFVEWEQSSHGQANIECFDCHLSHSQGLRTGSEEALCSACHEAREVETLHMTHRIDGMACSGCHMSEQMSGAHGAATVEVSADTHGFEVGSEKCLECHSETIGAIGGAAGAAAVVVGAATDGEKLVVETARADALEAEAQQLERRFTGMRNAAVMGMGLALGVGGFLGLAVGIAGMALLRKSKPSEEEQP